MINQTESISGYLLKKGKDLYLTNDGKWKSFCNTTTEFLSLESVKKTQTETRAKTSIVEVTDVFKGNNNSTNYERKERVL